MAVYLISLSDKRHDCDTISTMNDLVGIIGYGVLGKAYATALGIEMYIDLNTSSVELSEMCEKARWILICVPTPPTKNGDCDTSNVERWVEKISKEKKDNVVVIKSTVIPKTAAKLMTKYRIEIISAPEFLTESTAEKDALNPDLEVLGVTNKKLAEEFYNYQKEVRKGNIYNPHLMITDNTTAEFIKYSINSFYATKVIFANEIYNKAKEIGIDYDVIMDTMYRRKWIGGNHLKVFHKGKRGYTGKCLPKDMLAFSRLTNSPFLKLVNDINKKLVAENDDELWFEIINGTNPTNP